MLVRNRCSSWKDKTVFHVWPGSTTVAMFTTADVLFVHPTTGITTFRLPLVTESARVACRDKKKKKKNNTTDRQRWTARHEQQQQKSHRWNVFYCFAPRTVNILSDTR